MIDVNELRKKFPAKDRGRRQRKNAALKQIAREYEMKRAEMDGLKAPAMKRGIVFYAVVVMGLLMLAGLILPMLGKGGRPRNPRANLDVRKSLDALAVALGRYRYHTGEYPSTEEGLEALASTKVVKAGWNGPYIKKVVKDPWGRAYVYIRNGADAKPTLYSKGPDGRGGTDDDFLADPALFDEPFRDTAWTKTWVPYKLRGYVVAPDAETKKVVESQVKGILAANAQAADAAARERRAFLAEEVTDLDVAEAAEEIGDRRNRGPVRMLTDWTYSDDREGQPVAVAARVRGDAAELFVNGEPRGRVPVADGSASWSVAYEPGEAKVIGWRDGSPIGEDAAKTSFAPDAVRVTLLDAALGDNETGFAVAEVVDEVGTVVPDRMRAAPDGSGVTFSLEGPGEIVRTVGNAVAFRRTGGSGDPLKLTATVRGVRHALVTIPWRGN